MNNKFHRLHPIHLSNRKHEAHDVLEDYQVRMKQLRSSTVFHPTSVTELAALPLARWFAEAHMEHLNRVVGDVWAIIRYKQEKPFNYSQWQQGPCDLMEPSIAVAMALVERANGPGYSPYQDHALGLRLCKGGVHKSGAYKGHPYGFGFFVDYVKLGQSVFEVELGHDLCVDGCEICAEDRRNEFRAAIFDSTKAAPSPEDCFSKIVQLKSDRWRYQKAKCPYCDRSIVVVPPGYKQALDWLIRVEALNGREVAF